MTIESTTMNPSVNKAINPPPGLIWITGFVRPELSYAVDPATGEVNHHCWSFIDEEGNDYPDDLMADSRKQLTEYDRMIIAQTSRDDDSVLDWFLGNAKRHGHSLDIIIPALIEWFGPAAEELAA